MAAPAFGSVGTYYAPGSTSSIASIPVPSGVAANDIVIVHLYKENANTVTPQAGFTEITPAATCAGFTHHTFWRRATGADSGTYTFLWSGAAVREGVAVRYTGCTITGTPVDVFSTAGRSTAGTTTPAVSTTTTGVDRLLVWSGMDLTAGTWTPPSGYTIRTGTGNRVAVATVAQAVAGATGSVTGSNTASDQQTASLLALFPVTAVSGTDAAAGGETRAVSAIVAASDPGTGVDSGQAGPNFAGTDPGTGGETGLVSLPVAGLEPGSGNDSALVAASTSVSEAAAGVDAGSVSAAVTSTNPGTGGDSGRISIRGTDTAAGGETQSSTAQVTGSNPGVGSEGGYYDTAFADLNLSLWAVNATTGALTPLPDFTSLTISPSRNSAGTISVSYPESGLNFALLRAMVTADRDLEVEVWLASSNAGAVRGYLQEASGDDVSEDPVWTFAGGGLELRMAEAVIYPQAVGSAYGNDKQEVVFNAATPGGMIGTLLTQAQGRGALTDVTKDFTGSVDSKGVAWPNVISTRFSPGARYDQVLDKLVDLGLVEWAVQWTGSARVLRMWAPPTRGTDRTTGPKPVILQEGRNLLDAARKWSVRSSGTAVLVSGADGVYQVAADAGAVSRRGRRIETSASANNLTSSAAVLAYAQTQLATVTPGVLQLTHGLGFLPGEPRPGTVFDVGDWVNSRTGSTLERLRVVEWSLTVDAEGLSGTVTLNDALTETIVRLQDRLQGITAGETVVGTSTSSVDNGIPTPPSGVVVSSIAYLQGSEVFASVTVGWIPPVLNTDGSTITDLAGYTVFYGVGTGPYLQAGSTTNASATSFSFVAVPGRTIHVAVEAFDRSGNVSAWSGVVDHTTASDVTPPAVTSAAVVSNYLGVLKVAWDGKTSTGADMLAASPDFDHVDVHLSTSSGFTPSPSTYFDRLFAAGTVVYTDGAYGVTYYAKLVSVDGSGNASAGSAQGFDTPAQLVQIDVGPDAIGRVQIIDGEIVNAKIALLAVQDGNVANLNVGKLVTGTLTASVTNSGIIRTATTGARTEQDAAGIRLYDSANTKTVDLSTVTGNASITGTFSSDLAGDRIIINPTTEPYPTIYFYDGGAGAMRAYINGVGTAGRIGLGMNSGPDAAGNQTTLFLLPEQIQLQYNTFVGTPNLRRGGYFFANTDTASIGATSPATPGTETNRAYISAHDDGRVEIYASNSKNVTITDDGGVKPKLVAPGGFISGGAAELWALGNTSIFPDYSGGVLTWRFTSGGGTIKTFVLDHPTDPDRYLVHGCTESPNAGVEYWATVDIDPVTGEAEVELPRYFEAATRIGGRSVHLTPISERLAVAGAPTASYPRNGRFRIYAPGCQQVSWLVKAIRADVAPLDAEPLRSAVDVRGTGPYRYIAS